MLRYIYHDYPYCQKRQNQKRSKENINICWISTSIKQIMVHWIMNLPKNRKIFLAYLISRIPSYPSASKKAENSIANTYPNAWILDYWHCCPCNRWLRCIARRKSRFRCNLWQDYDVLANVRKRRFSEAIQPQLDPVQLPSLDPSRTWNSKGFRKWQHNNSKSITYRLNEPIKYCQKLPLIRHRSQITRL